MKDDLLQIQNAVEKILISGLNKKFDFDCLKDYSEYPHNNPRILHEENQNTVNRKIVEVIAMLKYNSIQKEKYELSKIKEAQEQMKYINDLLNTIKKHEIKLAEEQTKYVNAIRLHEINEKKLENICAQKEMEITKLKAKIIELNDLSNSLRRRISRIKDQLKPHQVDSQNSDLHYTPVGITQVNAYKTSNENSLKSERADESLNTNQEGKDIQKDLMITFIKFLIALLFFILVLILITR